MFHIGFDFGSISNYEHWIVVRRLWGCYHDLTEKSDVI